LNVKKRELTWKNAEKLVTKLQMQQEFVEKKDCRQISHVDGGRQCHQQRENLTGKMEWL